MNKYLISFLLVLGLAGVVCDEVWAQEDASADAPISIAIAEVASVAVPADSGTLPTSPWYFLKEWRRGFNRLFTFNAEKRAELELKITGEKADELNKVSDEAKNDTDKEKGIELAISNYLDAKARLEARFKELDKDSNNPNIAALLAKWDAKIAEHKALFAELAKRHAGVQAVLDKVMDAKGKLNIKIDFKKAVSDIENLKADIAAGSQKSARTDCVAIQYDITALKQKLVSGKIYGPDFAVQLGILQNELRKCQGK